MAQGWIGQVAQAAQGSAKAEEGGEILQRLIRRELPTFVEAVSVSVKDLALYAAPSDLEADPEAQGMARRWLPELAPGKAPLANEPRGVFRCLLNATGLLEANLLVEHAAVPIQSLSLAAQPLNAKVDSENFHRVIGVLSAVLAPPPPPKAPHAQTSCPVELPRGGDATRESVGESVAFAWRAKQSRQWEVRADLETLHSGTFCLYTPPPFHFFFSHLAWLYRRRTSKLCSTFSRSSKAAWRLPRGTAAASKPAI